MDKFEYKTFTVTKNDHITAIGNSTRVNEKLDELLNIEGKDGWRLYDIKYAAGANESEWWEFALVIFSRKSDKE